MQSWVRVRAIAVNTFREAVRDRVLYGVLAFATFILVFTLALAELSLNQQERIVEDIGLASISFFSVIVAVFLGSSLLYKEIERKTLYVILPKPVHRHELLIGKYLGISLTAAVFIATMGALQIWVHSIERGAPLFATLGTPIVATGTLGFAFWRTRELTNVIAPWSIFVLAVSSASGVLGGVRLGPTLGALALDVGEVLVLASIAMLFSSFSTPFLTGGLTMGVWLVGRSADELGTLRSDVIPATLRNVSHALSWIVPNLNLFVPPRLLLGDDRMPAYLAGTLAYGVLYSALMLAVACYLFRKRDLT